MALTRAMSSDDPSDPPPIFVQADFGSAGGSSSGGFDVSTWLALIAFVGTIAFCTIQAIVAPRKTFCAELNGGLEPVPAAASATTTKKRTRKVE